VLFNLKKRFGLSYFMYVGGALYNQLSYGRAPLIMNVKRGLKMIPVAVLY